MRSGLAVCVMWSLLACAPAAQTTTETLALRTLPSCELAPVRTITLSAQGDFRRQQQQFELNGQMSFGDFFPPATRWLAVEADSGAAGGLVAVENGQPARDVLILPYGRSCPLGDPLAALPKDAAFTPLAGGGLLIAGGSDASGVASVRAFVLQPGAALVTEVKTGMLLGRAGATATAVGTRVLVAGGSQGDRYPANDTFEVYDGALQDFDVALSSRLRAGARRDHAAARLPDGRVLLVGGASELLGAPLASAELIDLEAKTSVKVGAELNVARVGASLLVLDSGIVLVALGNDGTVAAAHIAEVERFDPDQQRFTLVATLPTHPQAAVAKLEGDRVAYVGCDGASCQLSLLGFDTRGALAWLEPPYALDVQPQLERLRLLEQSDGRLLLTGRDPSAEIERQAFIIDLNTQTLAAQALGFVSRMPDQLLMLEDGTRVELNTDGASLLRMDVASELDQPPALLVGERTLHVALDAASHWDLGDGLRASVADARLDVPHLRFADASIALEVDSAATLLLEPEAAPPVELAIDARQVSIGGCKLSRTNAALTLERRGTRLSLAGGSTSCTAPRLTGRVGVALRAQQDTRVTAFSIRRL